jgi:hypothetical protein
MPHPLQEAIDRLSRKEEEAKILGGILSVCSNYFSLYLHHFLVC